MSFTPPGAGTYRLNWTFAASAGAFSRAVYLYALPTAQAAAQPTLNPKLKLKLVKNFDCTQSYGTNEFCDDGLSRVVETPIGKYRETGTNTAFSRFAYHFTIDAPGTPYLAVVEYPDDKERIMEVMIDNKMNRCGQTMESGLIMGGEFPNSSKFREFPLLFFPPDTDCGIQFMNWPIGLGCNAKAGKEERPPAACRSIKIYKVLDGLPTTALRNLPPEPNQRQIGFEVEDCSIWRDFGAGTLTYDMDFESLYLTLKRYADYMAYVGQNGFVHPLIYYEGALYPSDIVATDLSKNNSYLDFWPDLALELFKEKGITFIPSICFWVNPQLAKEACLGPDKDGVARGEDSVLQVAWNGDLGDLRLSNDLNYDILHPQVRQAYLNAVDDILNKYGDHPAFGGLSFWFLHWIGPWFASLQWGYSDRDIALFEKETGIKVEMQNEKTEQKEEGQKIAGGMQNAKTGGKDPKRFAKRYVFLTKKDPAVREQWIAWRCAKVKDLWMEIYKRVQAKNPKFTLTIETWGPLPSAHGICSIQDNWKPEDTNSIYVYYRKGGFDLNLYKDIPNLYIGKVIYHNRRPGDEVWYDQDMNYSPAFIDPFRNHGANAVWLEQDRREFDKMPQATKMPGYWLNEAAYHSEKSAPIMPHGDFYLEYYANALANFDLRLLTSGGMGNTVLGHETELREFIRAYRALPAEPFAVFNNVDDPVCVRFRQRDDGYYFYLVNREFYPVEAALSFTANGKFKLLDLAAGTLLNGRPGRPLKATVGPFRVLAFKAPKGVNLAGVTVTIPEANRKWLEDRVAAFKAACAELTRQGITVDRKTRGQLESVTGETEKALTEKRYSRLRHLLDSYPLKKLQRILTDKTFQSYLAVPDSFVEQYYQPREIRAGRVDKLPGLDPAAWEKNVAVDTFTEVMMIEGQYRPRPAPEKTTVAVLYDAENLGFFYHCYDPKVGKVMAKQVPHDGNVIAPDDDSVEVFLSKTSGNIPYSQFMANFGGSRCEKVMRENPAWYNPAWTIETQKLADGWIACVVIPFQALDQTPTVGDVWGLNLCRNYRGRHMAFRCDPVKGFHCPDYFAQLKFE